MAHHGIGCAKEFSIVIEQQWKMQLKRALTNCTGRCQLRLYLRVLITLCLKTLKSAKHAWTANKSPSFIFMCFRILSKKPTSQKKKKRSSAIRYFLASIQPHFPLPYSCASSSTGNIYMNLKCLNFFWSSYCTSKMLQRKSIWFAPLKPI